MLSYFQVLTLVVGLVILLISLLGGYFINKKASVLFDLTMTESLQAPVAL